jgi:CRISPR-associated protein Csd1
LWSILQATYGDIIKSNDALKKNLAERLLPTIIENCAFPIDIQRRAVQRAINRQSYKQDEQWQWEQNLGVACALYKGYYQRHPDKKKRRIYQMALETENHSRDYLYGRLLAIAENIEQFALDKAGEKRSTTAGRLMQRFADRPFSTWKNIELALQPYMQRLQNTYGGFVVDRKQKLDEVQNLFLSEDFIKDKALSGEFLLGFHCQRLALRKKNDTVKNEETEEGIEA